MNKITNRLAVVMPTYNQGMFLREAVVSVLGQTFRDWGMVIVDDASTDDTEGICREYTRDKRVRYVRREENGKGAGRALNTGFAWCEGELETWWASDNVLYAVAWERMIRFMDTHPEVDVVYTNGELGVMDVTGLVELARKNLWDEVDQNYAPNKALASPGYYYGLTWIWRRWVREKVGEFQAEPCEDADFFFRAEEVGAKFGFLPDTLSWGRRHNANLTRMVAGPGKWDLWTVRNAKKRRGMG